MRPATRSPRAPPSPGTRTARRCPGPAARCRSCSRTITSWWSTSRRACSACPPAPTPARRTPSSVGCGSTWPTCRPRGGFAERVHRLDRYTSGALAFALSREARAGLISTFRAHRIERHYLAIVAAPPREDRGVVDAPLRDAWVSGRRGVARAGEPQKPARTRWRVREALRGRGLAGGEAGHRPPAPDPGAPRPHRPAGPRRPGVRAPRSKAARDRGDRCCTRAAWPSPTR